MIWQVLKFLDLEEREKFKKNVDNFLVDLQIEREIHDFSEKSIYDNAQTKEERQKYLDKFFRVICLQVHEIGVHFSFSLRHCCIDDHNIFYYNHNNFPPVTQCINVRKFCQS